MLSVKITANNLTEEMASLILTKQWKLEAKSFKGERLRNFVFSLCTNEDHRYELRETLNSYRKEYGTKELKNDLYIENKPNYLDGFYVKTYQDDEIIVNVNYSHFIKKVLELVEETEKTTEVKDCKVNLNLRSYLTTKEKAEFFKSLNQLNDIKLTPAQKFIIDTALRDSGISVCAMKRQSGKTLVLGILNSINNKIFDMAHEGKIRDSRIELSISSAKVFKCNYNKDPFTKFNIDYDLFIKAYPNINNFCSNLILADDFELFQHHALKSLMELMKQNQLLTPEHKHRIIITTDINTVNTASQDDWLFEDMGKCGENHYFPYADTIVSNTKNCNVLIVNEIPYVLYQDEKQ